LAHHRRDLIERTHKILMAKDYIVCQMTGAFTSDPWSSKGLIDLLTGIPPVDYYAALDLPGRETLAPTICAPHTVVGELTATAAEALGLRAGTPIVNGSSDAVCGMIGTGAVGMERAAFNLTGTSEMIGHPRLGHRRQSHPLWTHPKRRRQPRLVRRVLDINI
jgi:xylulokinase